MSTTPNPYDPQGAPPQGTNYVQSGYQQFPLSQPPHPPVKKKMSTGKKVALSLLGLIVVSGIASTATHHNDKASPTVAVSDANQTTRTTHAPSATRSVTTSTAPAAKIGTPVVDGDLTFTINSVHCGIPSVGSDFMKETAQGQFCLVNMKVTNTGKSEATVDSDGQKLKDAQGNEYSYSSEASVALMGTSDDMFLKSINPGNSVSGTVAFDIPKGVKPTVLHVEGLGFTDSGVDVHLV